MNKRNARLAAEKEAVLRRFIEALDKPEDAEGTAGAGPDEVPVPVDPAT